MRCTTLCCSIAIVLAATPMHAEMVNPQPLVDLTQVHRIAVIGAPPEQRELLEKALVKDIPDVELASEEEADLLIQYSEIEVSSDDPKRGETAWVVSLSRLDCQNPEFGVPPGKPSDGPCEGRVFIRTDLGSMDGIVSGRQSGVSEFVAMLRRAIVAPMLSPNAVP